MGNGRGSTNYFITTLIYLTQKMFGLPRKEGSVEVKIISDT